MLKGAQVRYLMKESFAGFHRRKLTTGVTILIMGSSLLVLAVLTLATLNLDHLLAKARSSIDMRVFLLESLDPGQVAELQPRLLVIPGVKEVKFISSETALHEFRTSLGQDAGVLDFLETNPLPASYHIQFTAGARNLDSVRQIRDEIAAWPEVAEIIFNQGWVDALEGWSARFRMANLITGLIVFIAVVFVISNTVKLTMAASSRLIQIQKLVGATNGFIRLPFLCEGMLQGVLAGGLAMGLVAVASSFMQNRLSGMIFFSVEQIAGFIMFCMVLGLLGSWSAMRKYLTLQSEL
ncbi:MAG: ABC transporter permease [Gemmatimonadales bacterium]|nr:ABC transporter permease [Gemmatimonadales bacterium]